MEICQFEVYIQKDSLVIAFIDKMAEWLRRWTVNPLAQLAWVRIASKSHFNWLYGVMVSTLDFEFSNPSSNLGKKLVS